MNEQDNNKLAVIGPQALTFRVVDGDTARTANEWHGFLKQFRKGIVEYFKPIKQAQDEAKREVLDREKAELAKVDPIIERLSGQLVAYDRELERFRQEAARKQRELELEKQRLEQQAAAKEATDDEVADAWAKENEVEKQKAAVIIPEKTILSGGGFRDNWKVRLIPGEEHLIERKYLMPDEQKMGVVAREIKVEKKFPGWETWNDRKRFG